MPAMTATAKKGLAVFSLFVIGAVALAGVFALQRDSGMPDDLRGIAFANPAQLQGVALAGAKGAITFPATAQSRWILLALGYTHCPDICPFMLGNLAEVEAELRGRLDSTEMPQFVFLSVDPARDTTALLAEYVAYFSDSFVGLTGPRQAIDRVAKQLGAFYRYGPKDSDGAYGVDHSAEIFLIDPYGRLFGRFQPPLDPQETALKFESARQFFQQTKT